MWYGLLAATGRLTKVGGLPHLSPSGQWIASARPTGQLSVSNLIDIWKADDDGYVRTFKERFRVASNTRAREYVGRPLLRWTADDLIRVCWEFKRDDKPIRTLGYIRFDGTKWRAEHVDVNK